MATPTPPAAASAPNTAVGMKARLVRAHRRHQAQPAHQLHARGDAGRRALRRKDPRARTPRARPARRPRRHARARLRTCRRSPRRGQPFRSRARRRRRRSRRRARSRCRGRPAVHGRQRGRDVVLAPRRHAQPHDVHDQPLHDGCHTRAAAARRSRSPATAASCSDVLTFVARLMPSPPTVACAHAGHDARASRATMSAAATSRPSARRSWTKVM